MAKATFEFSNTLWVDLRSGQRQCGVRLYTRMGYEIEGIRKHGAIINGGPHDEHHIAKLLNQSPMWLPPILETDRLILRPLTLEDAESFFEYAKDSRVTELVTWGAHKSISDSRDFIFDVVQRNYRNKVPTPWAIALKAAHDKVIGTVGCFWVSKNARCMELAYALGANHWSQGFMTAASRAVMDFCFEEFGLNRIQARCMVENKGSTRVMEKIGMHFEGTFRDVHYECSRFWDMHQYALLKDKRSD